MRPAQLAPTARVGSRLSALEAGLALSLRSLPQAAAGPALLATPALQAV